MFVNNSAWNTRKPFSVTLDAAGTVTAVSGGALSFNMGLGAAVKLASGLTAEGLDRVPTGVWGAGAGAASVPELATRLSWRDRVASMRIPIRIASQTWWRPATTTKPAT